MCGVQEVMGLHNHSFPRTSGIVIYRFYHCVAREYEEALEVDWRGRAFVITNKKVQPQQRKQNIRIEITSEIVFYLVIGTYLYSR